MYSMEPLISKKFTLCKSNGYRWIKERNASRLYFKILQLTYKAVHGLAPNYMYPQSPFTTLKCLHSASQRALKPGCMGLATRSKTSSYSDRAFEVATSKLWGTISITTPVLLHQLVNSKHSSKRSCSINFIFFVITF